ncbi:ABC-F family ATP-binding cassette domain-containing protein [Sandaracinus amylolyticus]|uniref:Probable ATP-binding protein YbiT n=1 Tax=Sandaracinus amylolyticus TaxID=927083 RepID=A0A0F6YH10_9BACT|nr:ATP-binding cassette domain-containing protein [Sandaracinus amylolyticus]AKF04291.1 ABC transporter ATP-binding protein uup [Sandaracinus amylolyticus]
MISSEQLSLSYGSRVLFENVDIKFTPGNCYGLIGANGAGKSTFLRCLAGEQEPTSGRVVVGKSQRLSMLRQNHFAYDDVEALTAVLMGHARLHQVMVEKDAIYAKPDFTDEDGTRAAELEAEFGELDGWNAEANAGSLLNALGITDDKHQKLVKDLDDGEKVRVLLAQALFGDPDILLLDEPTNHLDVDSILWLEEFLLEFKNTVIVVSHDRHFLDKVCTHVADVDFQKVQLFSGNYSFWYESSQLALRQRQDANRRKEDKIKELKAFVQRFSANASKSRQASSRRSQLEKITLDDIKPSSRKYPYIVFDTQRELGKEVLFVDGITKRVDGVTLFENLRFSISKGEKVAIAGSDLATSTLLQVLAGEVAPDEGELRWGRSANLGYFPKEHDRFFSTQLNLIEWMRQFSTNQEENFVRSFLGRMLFSGEESKKSANVLSGGEKVRCMLARLMLQDPNVLLLDGPTNHLDLESITALNNGLLKFGGSMVVSSHDVQFVDSLVTRVIELAGERYYDLHMGYEQYLADEARLARAGKSHAP